MCEVKTGEFAPPLGSTDAEWKEMEEFTCALDSYNGRYWSPQTAEEVVAYYTGAKWQTYEKARIDLIREPVLQKKDSCSVVFAKFEKAHLGKAPRCIQPRDPRYNLLVGKYVKQIEHRIYRSIAKTYNKVHGGEGPTVIKGYDTIRTAAILRNKWLRFADPVCIGLDAKKFDMHVSSPAVRMEHSVYLKMFRGDQRLAALLKRQIQNKGRGYTKDGSLKFEIDGIRFSGDMNTALGNCIIMCALIWTWAKKCDVQIELANNGDDCVVILEREFETAFLTGCCEWFETKGFRMEVEPTVDDFEQMEFCQSHPVWNGREYTMSRSLSNVLIKDSMCLVPVDTDKSFQTWCAAVGMCGGSLSAGVPVMQSFYRAYRKMGLGAKPSRGYIASIYKNTGQEERMGIRYYGCATKTVRKKNRQQRRDTTTSSRKSPVATIKYEVRQIEAEARLSFWIAHGVTPDAQIELEKYFDEFSVKRGVANEVSSAQIKDSQFIDFPQH